MTVLEVNNLTKNFGGFTALSDINLEVKPGERLGLIGPNGSGKTTLINCVSGTIRDYEGEVVFNGENLNNLVAHKRARRGISRSFQIPKPFSSMTVKQNLLIPLEYAVTADQLDGLTIDSPTWATPTILFLEEGKEVFGHQGYMSPKDFYQALGYFKLGDSEAYKVAFQEGTDARFCKEYEIFKNTPDGVFVDKLSGAPLFDTRDRFNSSTGWLSFTKPVEGSVFTRPDNSYGMRRTEIRSTTSNIHLGHVFPDGPNGMPRYCINATVLEFVKRTDLNI